MEVELTLDHIITQEELLSVYKAFCISHDIELMQIDEHRFLLWHYQEFLTKGHFDHRPIYGAKFFGREKDGRYFFHGYVPNAEVGNAQMTNFKKSIDAIFNAK